jgi:hypothetical protein
MESTVGTRIRQGCHEPHQRCFSAEEPAKSGQWPQPGVSFRSAKAQASQRDAPAAFRSLQFGSDAAPGRRSWRRHQRRAGQEVGARQSGVDSGRPRGSATLRASDTRPCGSLRASAEMMAKEEGDGPGAQSGNCRPRRRGGGGDARGREARAAGG